MNGRKIVVVSVDALIASDLEVLARFPGVSPFFKDCAKVEQILSVYPSLTYPCHASILTGCYPDRHGIFHNEVFRTDGKEAPWYRYSSFLKTPTLLDVAKRNGFSTASVAWPVTCGADVDYLISKTYAPDDAEKINSLPVSRIFEENKYLLEGFETSRMDLFSQKCACSIIEEFKPDITLCYLTSIDHERHVKGVDTALHTEALEYVSVLLGRIAESVRKAGLFDDTTFVLLSDHGQIDVKQVFNINVVLKDLGLISLGDDGKILDWKMICHSSAFSGQVYTRDIPHAQALEILRKIRKEYPQCLGRIMTHFECRSLYRTDGPYDFMIDGTYGTAIGAAVNGNVLARHDNSDYKFSAATHGHSPENGDKPCFLLAGPGVRKGAVTGEACLVDEAPTILALLGTVMPASDGRVLEELLQP